MDKDLIRPDRTFRMLQQRKLTDPVLESVLVGRQDGRLLDFLALHRSCGLHGRELHRNRIIVQGTKLSVISVRAEEAC